MSCKSKNKMLSYNSMYFHKFHLLSIPPKICKIKTLHFHNGKGELFVEEKNPQNYLYTITIYICEY